MTQRKAKKNKIDSPTANDHEPATNGQAAPEPAGANDRPVPPPDEGQLDEAGHLREAVQNPGTREIPEVVVQPGAGPTLEIPAVAKGASRADSGKSGGRNPDLMGVPISRPGPHNWLVFYPERMLRTELLGHKPDRDRSADWHYVAPELQWAVQRDLKPVHVHLVYDTSGGGSSFLYIVPESDFSPYFNTLQQILSEEEASVRDHVFRILAPEKGARVCDWYYLPMPKT
jgi:hypothetical protein